MNIPALTPLDIATFVLAIITLLLVIATFRMGSEAKEQTKATLGMVEELKQDRKARTTPFVAVTRAWAQSNYQKGAVLQKLTGEHDRREASLLAQLRLPLQTGWR